MNISPMMIKAMFSALGISPEQVMTPILGAVSDIQEAKATAQRIEERLINIERHLGIETTFYPIASSMMIEIGGDHVQQS